MKPADADVIAVRVAFLYQTHKGILPDVAQPHGHMTMQLIAVPVQQIDECAMLWPECFLDDPDIVNAGGIIIIKS